MPCHPPTVTRHQHLQMPSRTHRRNRKDDLAACNILTPAWDANRAQIGWPPPWWWEAWFSKITTILSLDYSQTQPLMTKFANFSLPLILIPILPWTNTSLCMPTASRQWDPHRMICMLINQNKMEALHLRVIHLVRVRTDQVKTVVKRRFPKTNNPGILWNGNVIGVQSQSTKYQNRMLCSCITSRKAKLMPEEKQVVSICQLICPFMKNTAIQG